VAVAVSVGHDDDSARRARCRRRTGFILITTILLLSTATSPPRDDSCSSVSTFWLPLVHPRWPAPVAAITAVTVATATPPTAGRPVCRAPRLFGPGRHWQRARDHFSSRAEADRCYNVRDNNNNDNNDGNVYHYYYYYYDNNERCLSRVCARARFDYIIHSSRRFLHVCFTLTFYNNIIYNIRYMHTLQSWRRTLFHSSTKKFPISDDFAASPSNVFYLI